MTEWVIRNGIFYNSEDEANLAAEIPGLHLGGASTDAGYVAEAILASDWLAAHDREVRAKAWDEGAEAARAEDFWSDGFTPTPNPYRGEANA